MSDHVHILIGLKAGDGISAISCEISKPIPQKFINRKKWVRGRFSWQEGYGAFSYGHSQLAQSFGTFRIRNNIIGGEHSKTNT
jgi:hypothetical protein